MNTTNKTDIYGDEVKLLMYMFRFVCSPTWMKTNTNSLGMQVGFPCATELVEFTFSFYYHVHHLLIIRC